MTWVLPLLGLLCLLPGGGDLPGMVLPWPSVPSWAALTGGILLALSLGNPHAPRSKALTPKLLAISVIGLGAAMNLKVVAQVGLHGVGYTLAGISIAMGLGLALGRLLGVPRVVATLISVGTAICGGSAIAAAAPVLGADDEDMSMALGTVFLLNASALLLFPAIGHGLHLGQREFGLWAALAIHDTSSVVGAGSGYGPEALLVATTTKLARALWIVPVTLALGAWVARRERIQGQPKVRVKFPWFILGFLLLAALVTVLPLLRPAGLWVAALARRTLVLTLFLLGCGISREALRIVGLRPFLQGLLLWCCLGAGTLAAIRAGWVR